MKFEIEIDDAKIRTMIVNSLNDGFRLDPYSPGALAKEVKVLSHQAALSELSQLNISEIVKDVVADNAKGIIEDVVKHKLKEMTKKVFKELNDSGELM